MKKKDKMICEDCCCSGKEYKSCGGMFYGLGFVGAAIYNISVASGFWGVIVAILKAAIWPAYLVYKLFSYLGI